MTFGNGIIQEIYIQVLAKKQVPLVEETLSEIVFQYCKIVKQLIILSASLCSLASINLINFIQLFEQSVHTISSYNYPLDIRSFSVPGNLIG